MLKITGANGLGRLAVQVEGANARLLAQTLNRAMSPTTTRVRRELSAYTGARYKRVSQVVLEQKATPDNLTHSIRAKDGWSSLKDYGPREVRKGTSAAPWRRRLVFEDAFMMGGARGSRVPIPSLNGHVFVRMSKDRLPIHKMFGPNIAREMVHEGRAPKIAWESSVGTLRERILSELARRIKAGV